MTDKTFETAMFNFFSCTLFILESDYQWNDDEDDDYNFYKEIGYVAFGNTLQLAGALFQQRIDFSKWNAWEKGAYALTNCKNFCMYGKKCGKKLIKAGRQEYCYAQILHMLPKRIREKHYDYLPNVIKKEYTSGKELHFHNYPLD